MNIVGKLLIACTLFVAPLAASQRSEVSLAMTNIKKLVMQDQQLQTLFTQDERPEEFLEKAKIAARVTRFANIATELHDNLNPTLESLLVATGFTHRSEVTGPTQNYTAITQATQNDELRSLRDEVSRLRTQEKERLDAELAGFANSLEQVKKDGINFANVITETKERLMVFKHDLWQIEDAIAKMHASTTIQAQVGNMRSFFAQQIASLEQCCGEMTDKTEQLKTHGDSLAWVLKKQVVALADSQEKVRDAWLILNKINRQIEDMQQLSLKINDIKMLAVQTKFDLERRCDAAKAKTRKKKRD